MALACVQTAHPVGEGTFCRICGSTYVEVPDLPTASAPAGPPPPTPVAPTVESSATQALPLVPAQHVPAPADAENDHVVVPRHAAVEEPAPQSSRDVPPIVLHLLGGAGIGAALMAVLDRLVL